MIKESARLTCIWITVLCLLVQSVGAGAGGILCVGCTPLPGGWARVGLTATPCSVADECCNRPVEIAAVESCASDDCGDCDESEHDGGDCGCVDIPLNQNDGAIARPSVKFVLAFVHFLPVDWAALTASQDVEASARVRAASGPPLVRLLLPSARQTVLLI